MRKRSNEKGNVLLLVLVLIGLLALLSQGILQMAFGRISLSAAVRQAQRSQLGASAGAEELRSCLYGTDFSLSTKPPMPSFCLSRSWSDWTRKGSVYTAKRKDPIGEPPVILTAQFAADGLKVSTDSGK